MGPHDLGAAIANARSRLGQTAQEVGAASAISATYVRKLEQGVVNDPSPRVLRRVASALDVPFRTLMQSAGYLEGLDEQGDPLVIPTQLSEDERRAVLAFVDFLAARRCGRP